FELSDLQPDHGGDGSAGFVLSGISRLDRSGLPVSAAGDLNGDGIDDLLISAYQASPGGRYHAGEIYVVFGRDTDHSGLVPPEFELASLLPARGGDGSTGFVVTGINFYDLAGSSVAAAGDVNGDGIDDLLIGAATADLHDQANVGETFVVYGR